MTSAWRRKKNEGSSSPGEGAEEKTTRKREPINRFALASLLTGSVALIWVSIPLQKTLPLILSVIGVAAGILGLAAYFRSGKGKMWSVAGLSGSLLAACLGTIPIIRAWNDKPAENRLTQVPLRQPMAAAGSRGSPDVDSEWVDAGKKAVQQGDVRVRLISIMVGPVDFQGAAGAGGSPKGTSPKTGPKRPREKYIVIKLRVSNAGAGQLIQYTGWRHPSAGPNLNPAGLQDANGKK